MRAAACRARSRRVRDGLAMSSRKPIFPRMAAKKPNRTRSKLSSKRAATGTWYGMPAYAKDGSVLCFFQDARKFKTRYCTLGFTDTATLDDGETWPVAFALKEWTPAVEARIAELLRRAMG
jgi:hypothetical protein